MKRIISFVLCAVILISMAACKVSNGAKNSEAGQNNRIANPYIDCDTLEDAAKLAGFDFAVPEKLDGCDKREITAIEKQMIEVTFLSGGSEKVTMRKGVGTDDISGDYNSYPQVKTAEAGDITVTLKGKDGKVMLAVWKIGDHAYSIHSDGVSEDKMLEMVNSVS